MIVYNVKRQFFEMKADAEDARKDQGLPPSATHKIEIHNREDLALLLNTLTGLVPASEVLTVTSPEVPKQASVPPEVEGLEMVWDRFRSIKA